MSKRDRAILDLIAAGAVISRDIGAGVGDTTRVIWQVLLKLERHGKIARKGKVINRKGPPSVIWKVAA